MLKFKELLNEAKTDSELVDKLTNMKVNDTITVDPTDENLINAWNIAEAGIKKGIELLLGSKNGKLLIKRIK